MAQGKNDSHNKYVFSIVAIVLVVEVVAFIALIANYSPAFGYALNPAGYDSVVGAATETAAHAKQTDCVDSDTGTYYRTAGFVTYRGGKFYDNCVGSTLNEKYCDVNSNGDLVLETQNYLCKWGCEKGACY